MVAFAEAAEARLYHVSTAFLDAVAEGDRGATAARYAASKQEAERVVEAASVPHVILRPSVVIGDSATGAIGGFQGLYAVVGPLVSGRVPIIPFDSSWPIDFVPADVVADAIAAVVEHQVTEGTCWLTAGERALRVGEAVALIVVLAAEVGRPIRSPRFVPARVFDQPIGRAMLARLPRRTSATVSRLLDLFSVYLDRESPMPSSLDELARLAVMAPPDSRRSLTTSLRCWAQASGRGVTASGSGAGAGAGAGAETGAEVEADVEAEVA